MHTAAVFLDEPVNSYVVRHSRPVTVSCSADVPRENLSFECNGQVMDTGRIDYTEEVGKTTAAICKSNHIRLIYMIM